MNQCLHKDIDVNALIKRHTDELAPAIPGPLVLWLGDITCKICGERLFISSDAFLDNETGALGFELRSTTLKFQSMKQSPPIDIMLPTVNVDDFELL